MKDPQEYLIHIVEDDEQSRKLIITALTRLGFKIMESKNGNEALEHLKDKKPDIILVDAMMPELDGFELIKRIRLINELKETPIIMTTALDDAKHIKESISVGANAYIVKPINFERLKTKIKEFIHVNL
ncbi:MAG: response regulator [Spirochaetota bacterium]|nr:response regulator [Spirochaetota bacterium]